MSEAEKTLDDEFLLQHLPGQSEPMNALRAKIQKVNSPLLHEVADTMLLRGESGVGKNYLARVIAGHRQWKLLHPSPSKTDLADQLANLLDGFGEIHLPGLSDELVESQLFGHKKGTFTSADRDHHGLLHGEQADVLLDEIGDASSTLQTKLLGVLESRKFRPMGGGLSEEHEVGARLMFATNRPLEDWVKERKFREDLFWRLSAIEFRMPPLREEPELIRTLAKKLLEEITPGHAFSLRDKKPELTEEDLAWSMTYQWPGNIRQLRNALKAWLIELGEVSLEKIVEAMPTLHPRRMAGASLKAVVETHLEAMVAGTADMPGTPKAFTDGYVDEIESISGTWIDRQTHPLQVLQSLFPEVAEKTLKNLRSRWRAGSK